MSFIQSLFHLLIEPKLILMALGAGLFVSSIKLRFIVAFTIALIIELLFVRAHPGQEVSLFTLLTGTIASYLWLVVSHRLKLAFKNIRK